MLGADSSDEDDDDSEEEEETPTPKKVIKWIHLVPVCLLFASGFVTYY